MAKDSQLDPKPVRKAKAKGGPTMAESANDGESNNSKNQSGSRKNRGLKRSNIAAKALYTHNISGSDNYSKQGKSFQQSKI